MRIEEWISNDTSERKILITDNVSNANKIIRKAAKNGQNRINVSCVSLKQLAEEVIRADAAKRGIIKKINILDNDNCAIILDSVIRENKEEIEFIPEESFCLATTNEVLKSINQIRMNDTTDKYKSCNDKKINDIKMLIELYEGKLSNNDFIDYTEALKLVCSILSNQNKKSSDKYGVIEGIRFTEKENKFLELLTNNEWEKIYYLPENNDIKADVGFFKSYGNINEVRYIADDIMKNNIAAGNVNIFYSCNEQERYIHSVLGSRKIPYSFITGCSGQIYDAVALL